MTTGIEGENHTKWPAGAPFLTESEANSSASDSATLFTGAEKGDPSAGGSWSFTADTAETGTRVQRVRGYTTGEPVFLKQTAWSGGPAGTENLKSPSPLLGFGKVLSLMPGA